MTLCYLLGDRSAAADLCVAAGRVQSPLDALEASH